MKNRKISVHPSYFQQPYRHHRTLRDDGGKIQIKEGILNLIKNYAMHSMSVISSLFLKALTRLYSTDNFN